MNGKVSGLHPTYFPAGIAGTDASVARWRESTVHIVESSAMLVPVV
jgi:hypothetical protein